jgi:UDP-N-acetyl-D-mannosaminuronate dehydrogenase
MKLENGKQSVEVITEGRACLAGFWHFCQNGHQSTGVDISVEQFDMLNELVTKPEVVEFYEQKRLIGQRKATE